MRPHAYAFINHPPLSVNVFYRVTHEPPDPNTRNNIERTRQEREFKIGSIGFADSTGILFASIFAIPTVLELCRAQVRRALDKQSVYSMRASTPSICITILPPFLSGIVCQKKKLYSL